MLPSTPSQDFCLVFENKEKMVLVMEIAAGGELYDYLSERKSLEENEARRIFRQIATAVFYCHKVRLGPQPEHDLQRKGGTILPNTCDGILLLFWKLSYQIGDVN